MPATLFGEHLKREREMRGVSLEEISAATRISTRFLEAIENEQWDQLPGGVFNRGFIRSIARYLGLDEDGLVAEYALETKGESEKLPGPHASSETTRNWRPVVAALVVVGMVLAAGLLVYMVVGARIAARLNQRPLGTPLSTIAGSSASTPAQPKGADSEKDLPAASGATPASLPGGQPGAGASAALALKMEAGKPARVKVIADGKTVFDGTVQANDVKQFDARLTFEVTASDSSALLLELNGQTVPPIGTPGQPGSVTLTQNDLKPAAEETH